MASRILGELLFYPLGMDVTTLLLKKALNKISFPWSNRVYHVSPNSIKKIFAETDFVKVFQGEIALSPRFMAINDVARFVLRRMGDREEIDDSVALLLLYKIAREDEKVKYHFGKKSGEVSLWTVATIFNFINELRDYLDESELEGLGVVLSEELYEYERLRERALSIISLLDRYRKFLHERSVFDTKEAMIEAVEAPGKRYPSIEVLIIDGFLEWTPLQKRFIERLIENAEFTIVALPQAEELGDAATLVEDSISFLRGLGRWREKSLRKGRSKTERLYSFPSEQSEITWVTAEVKRTLFQHPNKRILITGPNMSFYGPLIEESLMRAGVPFESWIGRRKKTDPGISILFDLIECVVEGLPREGVLRILRSPLLKIDRKLTERLDYITRALGIVSGDDWIPPIERHYIYSTGVKGIDIHEKYKREFAELMEKMMPLLTPFKEPQSPNNFAHNFREFWRKMEGYEFREGESDLPRVLSMLEMIDDVKLNPKDFLAFLGTLVESSQELEWGRPEMPVHLIDFRSTRGLEADFVFFVGVVDKDLPAKRQPDPFIPDRVREKVGLPTQSHHYLLQELDFERITRSWKEDAYISFPETLKGKVMVRSIFTDDFHIQKVKSTQKLGVFTKEDEQRFLSLKGGDTYRDYISRTDDLGNLFKKAALLIKKKGVLDVTEIDRYNRCKFRFLHEDLMRLAFVEEPSYEFDARKLGSVVHRVLKEVYRDGKYKGSNLESKLSESVEKISKEMGLPDFWKNALLGYLEEREQILIDLEEQGKSQGLKPRYTELRLEGRIIDGFPLIGMIDRVDWGEDKVVLIDYKTGKAPKIQIEDDKIMGLQILLYALLYKNIFPDVKEIECVFVSMKSEEKSTKKDLRLEDSDGKDQLNKVVENTRDLLEGMTTGDFEPEPLDHKEDCFGCIFSIPGTLNVRRCPFWLKK